MEAISPIERPTNLDTVVSIFTNLEVLGYISHFSAHVRYAYAGITPGIQNRFDSIKTLPHIRVDPDVIGDYHREIVSGKPEEILPFLNSPYPVQFEFYFAPEKWVDGREINRSCRLGLLYHMTYWIKLEGKTNEYYISSEPVEGGVISPDRDIVVQLPFNKDGIPLPCIDHFPFNETCIPRFREIRKLFDESGLPKNLEKKITATEMWQQFKKDEGLS